MALRSLHAYLIRRTINRTPVRDFNQIVQRPHTLDFIDAADDLGFQARVYVEPGAEHEPDWAAFLRDGLGELPGIRPTVANRAVLVVKIRDGEHDRFFAFPFGSGRHLLRPGSYVNNFGLRLALNVIYPRSMPVSSTRLSAQRVRSVAARTIGDTTLHTRQQTSRKMDFDTFGIDVRRDMLMAITGTPADLEQWGRRITGADWVGLNLPTEFAELGERCRAMLHGYHKPDYREDFGWIDNVRLVRDSERIRALDDHLVALLRNGGDHAHLAPPDILDFDALSGFQYTTEAGTGNLHDDLDLSDFLDSLRQHARKPLDVEHLKRHHAVAYEEQQTTPSHRWSIYDCIVAEITVGGEAYLLNGGDYFQVAPDFRAEVDADIRRIPEFPKPLPTPNRRMCEPEYNRFVAESSPDILLLDGELIRVQSLTTPVEPCDLLTANGQFLHVKRASRSSTLSHLFAQGTVSAELFLDSQGFRRQLAEVVGTAEGKRVADTGDDSFIGRFAPLIATTNPIRPSRYEVVYVIMGKWGGRSLADGLPFFSKLNLRQHSQRLRRMGYRVSCATVPA